MHDKHASVSKRLRILCLSNLLPKPAQAVWIRPMVLRIRKGAFDSIRNMVLKAGNSFPQEMEESVKTIASNGGTPLVVSQNEKILGVIELQDIIKTGISERFERLRKMGVKTVMVTGDNPLNRQIYC